MLQSPAPTALFVQLKPNKLISIGSGTSSDLRLPGTALNHITINGVDKLLSNGSTEVGLNGVNIIEETVLVHGDILRKVSKLRSPDQTSRSENALCRFKCDALSASKDRLQTDKKSTKLQAHLS